MKKIIFLSIVCIGFLHALEQLDDITITERVDIQQVSDVSGEEIKSSDLAEALEKNSPSVTIVRRSGIANDIILRGQKRDNINVIVDGMKLYGACPNRMDPPTSHIMTQNIDSVEITEGPFDVEEFGTLSGKIKVKTVKPDKKLSGEINLNGGSWDYQKEMARVSGGTDNIKVMVSGSIEKGGQYRDGNGDNFAKQLSNQVDGTSQAGMGYLPNQKNKDAFKRKSVMSKIFWDITPDQELKVGYIGNRSDGILYPNTPMDADYDNSDLYNIDYSIKNLSTTSKKLELQIYQTEVTHPMSTQYRKASKVKGVIKHELTTKMQGVKLKNSLDMNSHKLKIGVDVSKRNWDGKFYKNGN
ncbi:MAG: TonB-dependent receptor plug domain-containing protein, partial [Sulfurovaceae bacterium]|nr:TonB-dependent receptor plug domain-containing protein [Sulfurovaceae bacterium]